MLQLPSDGQKDRSPDYADLEEWKICEPLWIPTQWQLIIVSNTGSPTLNFPHLQERLEPLCFLLSFPLSHLLLFCLCYCTSAWPAPQMDHPTGSHGSSWQVPLASSSSQEHFFFLSFSDSLSSHVLWKTFIPFEPSSQLKNEQTKNQYFHCRKEPVDNRISHSHSQSPKVSINYMQKFLLPKST